MSSKNKNHIDVVLPPHQLLDPKEYAEWMQELQESIQTEK